MANEAVVTGVGIEVFGVAPSSTTDARTTQVAAEVWATTSYTVLIPKPNYGAILLVGL